MTATLFLPILLGVMALGLLMRRKLATVFGIFVLTMAFGGTAVVIAPALGGASILMSHMAFLLLLAGAVATAPTNLLLGAARTHAPGLLLAIYALIIGYFGPRLFGGDDVMVVPMRNTGSTEIAFHPQSSNITHTLYLIASILLAWVMTMLFRARLVFADLRNAVLLLGFVHAAFGFIDFVFSVGGTRTVLGFLRNASYGMLDQTLNGVPRAAGAYPEPSSYATVSATLMIFCAELWLQKRDKLAGLIALALAGSIALSISSAGIFAMAVYGALLVLRLGSSYRSPGMFARLLAFLAASLVVVAGLFFTIMLAPGGLGDYGDVFSLMTLDKLGTSSASERTGWAMQGVTFFADSMGFGVGAGSFRSSSFLTAVIGSLGVVGVLLLGAYIVQLLGVIGRRGSQSVDYRVAAWAALGALVPQLVVGVTPDPGFLFALFAGVALAQREQVAMPAFATARMAG